MCIRDSVAAAEAVARMAQAQQDQTATEKEQAAAIAMAEARTAATKRQAELQAEAETALKKAAQAGPLADAIAKQQVVEAETRTAELRADLTAKQLETDVRKPADAEAYAAKVTAEGKRDADIAASEAAARQVQLSAAAEAERVKAVSYTHLDVYKRQGPERPQRGDRKVLRRSAHHQGRCVGCQGNRTG